MADDAEVPRAVFWFGGALAAMVVVGALCTVLLKSKDGRELREALRYAELAKECVSRGDVDEAERMLRKALPIFQRLNREADVAALTFSLGCLGLKRGDVDSAEEALRKSIAASERLGLDNWLARGYSALAYIHLERGELELAEELFRKAIPIAEQLGPARWLAKAYGCLGAIHQKRGELDPAEEMHRRSLAVSEQLSYKPGIAAHYLNMGGVFTTRGDRDRALEYLTKARDLFAEIDKPDLVKKTQRQIDKLDANLGRPADGASKMIFE